MPFIGNQPAESYSAFQKQDFSTSATTSYTLDNPVANANELALFINFVRQEPTTAYSASGTSLTLTSATASSDDMYCVYLGKAVQTVNPPNASVGASQIVDASITSGKLASGVLPTNTPAFSAYGAGANLSNATDTKLTFGNTYYNVGSGYDTSTSRFTVPSGESGKYVFHAKYRIENDSGYIQIVFRKNGGVEAESREENGYGTQRYISVATTWSVGLSAGDYIEAWGLIGVGNTNGITHPIFHGYKIIE